MDEMKEKSSELKHKNEDSNEDGVFKNGSPKNKIAKLCPTTQQELAQLKINPNYTKKQITQELKTHWTTEQTSDFKDADTGAEIFADPFQIGLLPALLQDKQNCRELVDEMVNKVHWSRNQMDLYEFYQSTDLSNMGADCPLLANFLQLLRRHVRPWLEQITNLQLDYVSASCSMYTCGDYLLVHDDLLKDRQIAFIYYISPWENAEQWSTEQGGCLEIFSSDDHYLPHFPVRRKISPKNNQFAFFKVGTRSFHQVGEVTTYDYPRLTINGWFHGASNDEPITDNLRFFSKLDFKPPQEGCVEPLLNEIYFRPNTRRSIQKRIEDNSEICLYDFLRREVFEEMLSQLLGDKELKWRRQGPANVQNYEVLELSTATKTIAKIVELFKSAEMFALLRDYTDLDLAGPSSVAPSCSLELQRWSHGNYTVLGDGAFCEENTLDLIYYLNAAEGVGVVTYLSPDTEQEHPMQPNLTLSDTDEDEDDHDDSVLLTITPVDNALNIVYRCEGTTKFTKYVSHNTPLKNGPVFAFSCSYKE